MTRKNINQLNYSIEESDQFIIDVEEASIWILVTNLEQSESLAEKMLEEFERNLNELKSILKRYPKIGLEENILSIRKFPIFKGRYSAKWIVLEKQSRVILLSLTNLKYPKELRTFNLEEE